MIVLTTTHGKLKLNQQLIDSLFIIKTNQSRKDDAETIEKLLKAAKQVYDGEEEFECEIFLKSIKSLSEAL